MSVLKRIRVCQERLGKGQDFAARLATFRQTHKRRRNFLKLLDEAFGEK